MAAKMGLVGKKIGMTQTFDQKGARKAVTVVEVGPCVVLDIRTKEKHGYTAIQIGFDEQKPTRVSKPRAGLFAKVGTAPRRVVREFRLSEDEVGQFQVGQELSAADVFATGDVVDVTGRSKGKGFQGVMKRYHFRGFEATHGTHEYFRHGGSIGCRLTPGHVHKGKRMPGQMGDVRTTVQNLRVTQVIPEKNLLLVHGAVPGSPDGYVLLRHAVKSQLPPFQLRKPEPTADEGEAEASA